jgi:hypothetical protein
MKGNRDEIKHGKSRPIYSINRRTISYIFNILGTENLLGFDRTNTTTYSGHWILSVICTF